METFCFNDEVYCKCRTCIESQTNDGSCSHCVCCINGEKAMDICFVYKNNGDIICED